MLLFNILAVVVLKIPITHIIKCLLIHDRQNAVSVYRKYLYYTKLLLLMFSYVRMY